MVREKHGDYDTKQHLPANTGKPVGTGIYVWLQEEIEKCWPGLVAQSYQMIKSGQIKAEQRYQWLLSQIEKIPEATQLIEDFHTRRKSESRQRAQRDRKSLLQTKKQRLAESTNEQEQIYLQTTIDRLQKQIDKAEKSR